MISRRLRFRLWIALAVAIPLIDVFWMWRLRDGAAIDERRSLIGGCVLINALLLLVVVLLGTTPRDAIRLKPLSSLYIITAVSMLLHLAALALFPAILWHQLLLAAASVGAAAVVCATLIYRGQSQWWTVLLAWNPLVLLIIRALR